MNKITGRFLILNIDKDEDISNWASSDGDRIVTSKVAFYPFLLKYFIYNKMIFILLRHFGDKIKY